MHKGRSRTTTSDVYRVEHLVDKRIRGNRTEYLVKWKNWSDEHNTWEPAKNILDKRLIESYERREKRKKNQQTSSSSSSTTTTARDRSHSTDSQRSSLHSPDRHHQHQLQQQQQQQPIKSEEASSSNLASIDPILSTLLPSSTTSTSTSINTSCYSELPIISQSIKSPQPLSSSSISTSPPPLPPPPLPGNDSIPPSHQWEFNDLCYDRRFRRTTLLVAAASASAANAAAALAHSRLSGRQAAQQQLSTTQTMTATTLTPTTSTTTTTIINTTPCCSIENINNSIINLQSQSKMTKTEVAAGVATATATTLTPLPLDENIELRPKIRLTIPRDRILPCPPIGVSSNSSISSINNTSINNLSSSSSSTSNQCLDDLDHSMSILETTAIRHDDVTSNNSSGQFIAPVELPRRCYNASSLTTTPLSPHSLINPTSGLRLSDIPIDSRCHLLHDIETNKSPKWNKQLQQCTTTTSSSSSSSMMTQLPKLLISSTNLSSTSPSPSSTSIPYDFMISGGGDACGGSSVSTKKRKRLFSSESCLSSPSPGYNIEHERQHEHVVSKKRKHSQKKKEKRKRRHEEISDYHQEQQQQHHRRHHHHREHHHHHGKSGYTSSFEDYTLLNKIRRRSGSSSASHTSSTSSSNSSASTSSSSLSPTTTILSNTISPNHQEEGGGGGGGFPPRLAPLRIHLPRSIITSTHLTSSAPESCIENQSFIASCGMNYRNTHSSNTSNNNNNNNNNSNNNNNGVVIDHHTNNPSHIQINHSTKQIHLVPEMCITDITVNGLTISIKECSGPRNFFGIPTSQLVQYNSPVKKSEDSTTLTAGLEYTTPTTTTTTTTDSTSTTMTTTTAAAAASTATTLNNTSSSTGSGTTSTPPPPTTNSSHSSSTRTVKPLCVSLKEQNILTTTTTTNNTTTILSPSSTKLESFGVYQTPLTHSAAASITPLNPVNDDEDCGRGDENNVKKNSLYADENIAPGVIEESPIYRTDVLQLSVPISKSSSPLSPSTISITTTSDPITPIVSTSSSSDSDNQQIHRLSTIYEDTEPSSSASTVISSPIVEIVEITPPSSSLPPQPQQQQQQLEITSSTSSIHVCPIIDTELANKDNNNNNNHSHSTSSLLLAATEAITKSALDSPSSPGLLLFPPRRSSTPIEYSPVDDRKQSNTEGEEEKEEEEVNKSINNNVITSSSPDHFVSTSIITSTSGESTPTVSKSIIKSNTELSSSSVINFNRKHLNSKTMTTTTATSTTTTTTGCSISSPTLTRPMATIFGQVRNRSITSSEMTSTRKSSGKLKYTTIISLTSSPNLWNIKEKTSLLKPIGRINASHYEDPDRQNNNNNNNNHKKCTDPNKIYTFTGESSPTYNLNICEDDENISSSPLSLTTSPRRSICPSSSTASTVCSDLKHASINSSKVSRPSKHQHRNHDALKSSISSTSSPPPCMPPPPQPLGQPELSSFPLQQQSFLNMNNFPPSDLINKLGCSIEDIEMTTTTTTATTSANSGQCSNTEAALATAACLQHLQMQFMCNTNPIAIATALSALSGGGGGGVGGAGFPMNSSPYLLPSSNMNCPSIRFNFNSDMNNSSSTGNPANFDWSTLPSSSSSTTPFLPNTFNSIDSNLPMSCNPMLFSSNELNFPMSNLSSAMPYSTGVSNNNNNNNNNNNSAMLGQLHPIDGYSMAAMMMASTMNALKPGMMTSLPGRCDYYNQQQQQQHPLDNCYINGGVIGDTNGLFLESSDLPIDLSAKR